MKKRRTFVLPALLFFWISLPLTPSHSYRREATESASSVKASVIVDEFNTIRVLINSLVSNTKVKGYKIYVTGDQGISDDSYANWQQINVNTAERAYSFVIDKEALHLKPGAKYKLRVICKAENGESEPSETVEFCTKSEVPSSPSNVHVSVQPNNSFTVFFDAVIDPKGNPDSAFVKEYLIEFTKDNPASPNAAWSSKSVEVDHISKENIRISEFFDSSEVIPNTHYSLRVYANGKIRSVPSKVTIFETSSGAHVPVVSIPGASMLELGPSLSEPFVVVCKAVADPPAFISWLVDDQPLVAEERGFRIRHSTDGNTTYSEITVPSRSRSERFTCIASNDAGTGKATVEVRILGPGSPPNNVTAVNGVDRLNISWTPPLLSNGEIIKYVIYTTTNKSLSLDEWKKTVVDGSERIVTVESDTESDYFVRVQSESDRGPGIISETFHAKQSVTALPLKAEIVLVDFAGNLTAGNAVIEPGEDIRFKCIVRGRPLAIIYYYWQNKNESEGIPTSMALITLSPNAVESYEQTTRTYSSQYLVCRGKNSLETTHTKIFFEVRKPGFAPRNVHSVHTPDSEVTLLWEAPEIENIDNLWYKVYITDDITKAEEEWKVFETNSTRLDLSRADVGPSSMYFYRISAVNEHGEGLRSRQAHFVTPSAGPRGPPEDVTVELDEANVVVISWRKPNDTNGNLTKYTLYFTRDPSAEEEEYKSWQNVETPAVDEVTSFKMNQDALGLRPKAVYRVRITAHNDIAEGIPTSSFEFETTQGELPVPTDVEVEVLEDNTVVVRFTAVKNPDDHSVPIEDYEILLSTSSDVLIAQFLPVAIAEKTFDKGRNLIVMKIAPKELSTDTQYWAKVKAKIEDRNVQASRPKRFKTGDGKVAPVVRIRQGEHIEAEPSLTRQFHIECDGRGIPRPTLVWYWDGQIIRDRRDGWVITDITDNPIINKHNVSSRLTSATTSLSGAATCMAYNNKNSSSADIRVMIKGPGTPVKNIKIVPYRNSFNISWDKPDAPNGKIQRYILYYTKSPDKNLSEWTKAEILGSDHRTVIKPVEPLTEYFFKFGSLSDRGYGVLSETIKIKSRKHYVPLTAEIVIITKTDRLDSKIAVVKPSARIQFYCKAKGNPMPQIRYFWSSHGITTSEGATDAKHMFPLKWISEEYTVITLEKTTSTRTTRDLTCRAQNEDGFADAKIRFVVDKPGSPPGDIKYRVTSENDVTISWKKPLHPNGEITGYTAYLTKNPSAPLSEWKKVDIDGGRRRFTFVRGELDENSEYMLRMRARNQNGDGILSKTIVVTTANGGPLDAPSHISVVCDKKNLVTVSWIPPTIPNGEIKGYVFYFTRRRLFADSEYRKWQMVDIRGTPPSLNESLQFNLSMVRFRPNEVYRLRMSAKNEVAEGPVSDIVYFETKSEVFDAPENVKVEVEDDLVRIHFDAVRDARRPGHEEFIKEYIIFLARTPIDQETEWFPVKHSEALSNERVQAAISTKDLKSSRYAIKVAAYSGYKIGDKSEPIEFNISPDKHTATE